jgi:hypothetical protein
VGQERGPGAESRSRSRGFTAGVATSDNDDVERLLHRQTSSGMRLGLEEHFTGERFNVSRETNQFVSRETPLKEIKKSFL